MFGGLGGNFYKDTYDVKLFGMHVGRFCLMRTSLGFQPFRRYIIKRDSKTLIDGSIRDSHVFRCLGAL